VRYSALHAFCSLSAITFHSESQTLALSLGDMAVNQELSMENSSGLSFSMGRRPPPPRVWVFHCMSTCQIISLLASIASRKISLLMHGLSSYDFLSVSSWMV